MDEREELIDQVLMSEHQFYRLLQAGVGRYWIEVDLTMPQVKVLFLVAGGGGIRMTQLARSLAMTFSTATGIVDRLFAQGLVRREQDPRDRRLVLVHPTEEGARLVEGLLEVSRARFRQILSRLSFDELRMASRTLEVLYAAAISVAESENAAEAVI
jgi:DNA-binding MarR family transcriptional regulator